MSDLILQPGAVSLSQWRAIYRGARPSLDPGCMPAVHKSAAAVERILAYGEPVYGINTGFGKLASVRIEDADMLKAGTLLFDALKLALEPAGAAATAAAMGPLRDRLAGKRVGVLVCGSNIGEAKVADLIAKGRDLLG